MHQHVLMIARQLGIAAIGAILAANSAFAGRIPKGTGTKSGFRTELPESRPHEPGHGRMETGGLPAQARRLVDQAAESEGGKAPPVTKEDFANLCSKTDVRAREKAGASIMKAAKHHANLKWDQRSHTQGTKDDLVQAIVLRLLLRCDKDPSKLEAIRNPGGYLYTVAKNEAENMRQAPGRTDPATGAWVDHEFQALDDVQLQAAGVTAERTRLIKKALNKVNDPNEFTAAERQVFVLLQYEMNQIGIAERLAIPLSRVRSLIEQIELKMNSEVRLVDGRLVVVPNYSKLQYTQVVMAD